MAACNRQFSVAGAALIVNKAGSNLGLGKETARDSNNPENPREKRQFAGKLAHFWPT